MQSLVSIRNAAALITILFVFYPPLFYQQAQFEDAPGIMVIGMFIAFLSAVIAGFAALLQKLFENAFNLKEENDLTV